MNVYLVTSEYGPAEADPGSEQGGAAGLVLLADEVAAPGETFRDVFEVEFPEGFPLHRFAVNEPDAPVGWRREWLMRGELLSRHATVRCGIPSPYA